MRSSGRVNELYLLLEWRKWPTWAGLGCPAVARGQAGVGLGWVRFGVPRGRGAPCYPPPRPALQPAADADADGSDGCRLRLTSR